MKKKKRNLFKYLVLSLLIHLGVLFGTAAYLIPIPATSEQPIIIPFDTVLIEEEREKEQSPAQLTSLGHGSLQEPLVAKIQTAMGTPSASELEDLPGPVPKQGSFRPSLSMEQMPSPGVLPVGEEGKEARSRQVVSPSVAPPLQLPEILTSPPDQSPILGLEETRVLTEAERGGIPMASLRFEKTTAPLGRNRAQADAVSELPPIPTIESPRLPEEREMVLAQEATDAPVAERKTFSAYGAVQPKTKVERGWDMPVPKQVTSLEPLTRGFKSKRTFPGVGQVFVMLLVIDTSGSVKGPPLTGIKRSAAEFVNLLGDTDRCAIMTVDDDASLIVPFMSDKARLGSEIAGLQPQGRNTVLFDALDRAFTLLNKEKEKQRFVVLFSDGKDEGSRLTSGEVISKARKSQISVFCLGYSQIERQYLRTLEALSQETGGLFAEAPHFQEIVELFRAAKTSRRQKGIVSLPVIRRSSG